MQVSEISQRIAEIRERMAQAAAESGRPADAVELMAVTKTVSPDRVNAAYAAGIRLFGENRMQEYLEKESLYSYGPSLVHFIGHLQTNKVKYIINKVSMIESVDTVHLGQEIAERARTCDVVMPILLEVNISGESTKSGFSEAGFREALRVLSEYPNLSIQGAMCIPERQRGDYYFAKMQECFAENRIRYPELPLRVLSMGMSEDYTDAIRRGSTLVRIGSGIFGPRM